MINEMSKGPLSLQNWLAHEAREPSISCTEYPFFTDAHIVGEISDGLGPYQFINLCPNPFRSGSKLTLVFRAEFYLTYDEVQKELTQTNDDEYHGGYYQDEIAALVGLCLGCRMKAGGASRIFEGGANHRGRPIAWESEVDPIAHNVTPLSILPRANETKSLELTRQLASFPCLTAVQATVLVRAARLHQDAMWMVESNPELAWLMFVSAIETAANCWKMENERPIERLRASKPDLEVLLLSRGDEEFVEQVASLVASYMGSTKKFIDFTLEFIPDPPENRPAEFAQVLWTRKNLKESLSKIYDYRSKALHGGRPFPAPMCMPPYTFDKNTLSEKSVGLAVGVKGSTWVTKDLPMLLHTFEYIVRNVLLGWWRSLGVN